MPDNGDYDAERNPHRVNALRDPDDDDRDHADHANFQRAWIAAGQRKVWDPERRCWWTVSNEAKR